MTDFNYISAIVRQGLLHLNKVNFNEISSSLRNISIVDTNQIEQTVNKMHELNQAAIQNINTPSTINWNLINPITDQSTAMFKNMDRTQ